MVICRRLSLAGTRYVMRGVIAAAAVCSADSVVSAEEPREVRSSPMAMAPAMPFVAGEDFVANDGPSRVPMVVMSMNDGGPGAVLRVDIDSPAGGDGLSWATAFNSIDAALDTANGLNLEVVEVRVAQGTYVPTNPPLLVGVGVIGQVILRGGFPGADAADPDAQDIPGNPTTISGDVLGDDQPGFVNREDNLGALIEGFGTLEGLIVTGGQGEPEGEDGVFSLEGPSPVVFQGLIQHCLLMENQGVLGGAVRSSDLLIVESDFISNRATFAGGAVYGESLSQIRIVRSLFTSNRAPNGGAVWSENLPPPPTNEPGVVAYYSIFSGNRASGGPAQNFGGAIGAFSRATIANCTFVDNSVDVGQGGALYFLFNDLTTIVNCIFAYNEAGGIPDHVFCQEALLLNFCLFGDDSPKRTSTLQLLPELIGEPRFIDRFGPDGIGGTGDENLRLAAGSPAIDTGSDSIGFSIPIPLPPEFLHIDFDGLTVPIDDPVVTTCAGTNECTDIGAYEYQYDCDGNGIVDALDIAMGTLTDCNDDGVPDVCQPGNCNGSGIPDVCEIFLGLESDCNNNGVPDSCELLSGALADADKNGIPDVCELLVLRVASTDAGWDDAIGDLQDALDIANARAFGPTDIWVAAGTYTPDRGTLDRGQAFKIRSGVRLLGGFVGDESAESQRDVAANPTILSGDLLANDHDGENLRDDNTLRVVHLLGNGSKGPAVLDGFTVTGGYTIGPIAFIGYIFYGFAPMYSFGGGVYASGSDLRIFRSTITRNTAGLKGNGIFLEGWSKLEIRNSIIAENHWDVFSGLHFGGGIASHGSLSIFDSVVSDNGFAPGAELNNNIFAGGIGAYGPTNIVNTTVKSNVAAFNAGVMAGPTTASSIGFADQTAPLVTSPANLAIVNSSVLSNVALLNQSQTGVAIWYGHPHLASLPSQRMSIVNSLVAGNVSRAGSSGQLGSSPIVSAISGGLVQGVFNSIVNSTISHNLRLPTSAGAVRLLSRTVTHNSIVWNNLDPDQPTSVGWQTQIIGPPAFDKQGESILSTHNTIQGWTAESFYPDPSNNALDPLFIDPLGPDAIPATGDEDFRLAADSPLLDSADASLLPDDAFDLNNNGDILEPIPFDLDGNQRVLDLPGVTNDPAALDRGAYERQLVPGCAEDVNGDGVVDTADLGILLGAFGQLGPDLPADLNGDGVVDTTDLGTLLGAFGQACG